MLTKFWLEILKERDQSEGQGVDRRIILKLILRNMVGGCGRNHAPQYRDRWRVLVNTVMNLCIP
jgi:hypothetical protein